MFWPQTTRFVTGDAEKSKLRYFKFKVHNMFKVQLYFKVFQKVARIRSANPCAKNLKALV